jgi:hypothetical protein
MFRKLCFNCLRCPTAPSAIHIDADFRFEIEIAANGGTTFDKTLCLCYAYLTDFKGSGVPA